MSFYFLYLTNEYLREQPELNSDDVIRYTTKLRRYPIVLIITVVPLGIFRIFELYDNDFIFPLEIIQTIIDSSRGILFVIFFGLTPSVLKSAFGGGEDLNISTVSEEYRLQSIRFNNSNANNFNFNEGSFISANDDFEFGKKGRQISF